MAVVDAGRTHGTAPGSIEDLPHAWRPTSPVTSRIVKMDLNALELREVRSMLSDQTVTDVYVRTSSYDGEPEALVDVVEILVDLVDDATFTQSWLPPSDAVGLDRINRRRLDAAFDRIGHLGKPAFRRRLADAYDQVA